MVLPGGFKYFLFLEISNPLVFFFFFGFHDPLHLRSIFFQNGLGGCNHQPDVDLFPDF